MKQLTLIVLLLSVVSCANNSTTDPNRMTVTALSSSADDAEKKATNRAKTKCENKDVIVIDIRTKRATKGLKYSGGRPTLHSDLLTEEKRYKTTIVFKCL